MKPIKTALWLLLKCLSLSTAILASSGASYAQGAALSGESDGWKDFLAKVAREGAGQMTLQGPVAAKFASTFKSQSPVIASAKVVNELSIKGCKKLLVTISMPGATAKDTAGREHPVEMRSNINMCIDGSIPGQEQLTAQERTK
jgi:hypothetical protein